MKGGAQFIISRLQQVKGHKCCQIGLKGLGSGGRWRELGAVEGGGGIDGIQG